jgi:hypothetical protein
MMLFSISLHIPLPLLQSIHIIEKLMGKEVRFIRIGFTFIYYMIYTQKSSVCWR